MARHGEPLKWLMEHSAHQDRQECLIWPFARDGKGYGSTHVERRHIGAHRYMCQLAHGAAPSPEHHATHSCGKGAVGCVNPHHLRWATASQNRQDAFLHGTAANQYGKVTPRKARSFRQKRYRNGLIERDAALDAYL